MRGLPGADRDRLPLAVPIVPGEQTASWLALAAYRYGLTPSALLAAVGLRPSSWSPRTVPAYLARHADVVERRLGYSPCLPAARGDSPPESTAFPPEDSAGLDAADRDAEEAVDGRYLQAVLASYRQTYRGTAGGWRAGSRFCPSCLAASGGVWPASWTSPLHLVCLTHQQLLVTGCATVWRSAWPACVDLEAPCSTPTAEGPSASDLRPTVIGSTRTRPSSSQRSEVPRL